MRGINYLGIIMILSMVLLTACPEPPEFDFSPKISFNDVRFFNVTVNDPAGTDTLIIAVNFQDGDGDLGLRNSDVDPPFHPFKFLTNPDGSPLTYADVGRNPSFNPIDYITDTAVFWRGDVIRDTFRIERNENFFNIFIKFYVKRQNEWQFLDIEGAPFFTTFNGRFPLLNTESYARPIEGVINYKMISAGFRTLFRLDSVKLEVSIQDRALNRSNVVETPAFTLPSITVTN